MVGWELVVVVVDVVVVDDVVVVVVVSSSSSFPVRARQSVPVLIPVDAAAAGVSRVVGWELVVVVVVDVVDDVVDDVFVSLSPGV